MQRKSAKPAMYELMKGQRLQGSGAPPVFHRPTPEPSMNHAANDAPTMSWLDWLRARRFVRMPAGYLSLGIAAVLLLLVFAYMFGYSRGEKGAVNEAGTIGEPGFEVNDPLATGVPKLPGSPITNRSGSDGGMSRPNPGATTSRDAPIDTEAKLPVFDMSKLGPVASDPRQKGANYYVLATTNPSGAERLAVFCREHGLAAFVVAARGKSSLRQVIVLPGFTSTTLPAVRELRERILEVGRKWKTAERGSDDLSGCYADRFDG